MKQLHFNRPNNLSLLHDELLEAMPSLRSDSTLGLHQEPIMRVEGLDNELWLTVPDEADEAAIQAIVQAHDHTIVQPDAHKQRLDRIYEINAVPRSQWTSAQMRELIHLVAQELR